MAASQDQNGDFVSELEAIPARGGLQNQKKGDPTPEVSPEAIRVLPSEFVKRDRILPLRISNGTIHVATVEPADQRLIDDIRLLSGLEVEESHAPASEILERIAESYQVTVEQMIENLNPELG